MNSLGPVSSFQALLQMGIDERNKALNPQNTICALPLSKEGKKIATHELALLQDLMMNFNALFEAF